MSKRKTPITEEAQSKPATELRRESRLFRIAKALASGATVTDIADAEGIGRTLASREANSPECRQLIAEFVGDEWEEMRAVFYRSMRAIEHALSARREYMTKEGQIMQGGPDHYARLAATKHFRDFLMASRPAPKQPEPKNMLMTLPELQEMLRAIRRVGRRRRHPETRWRGLPSFHLHRVFSCPYVGGARQRSCFSRGQFDQAVSQLYERHRGPSRAPRV